MRPTGRGRAYTPQWPGLDGSVALLGLIGFLSAYPVAVNREDRSVIFHKFDYVWTTLLGFIGPHLSCGCHDHGRTRELAYIAPSRLVPKEAGYQERSAPS